MKTKVIICFSGKEDMSSPNSVNPNTTTKDAMSTGKIEEKLSFLMSYMININSNVRPLTKPQFEMINKLVYLQEEFESPSEEDVIKITVCL